MKEERAGNPWRFRIKGRETAVPCEAGLNGSIVPWLHVAADQLTSVWCHNFNVHTKMQWYSKRSLLFFQRYYYFFWALRDDSLPSDSPHNIPREDLLVDGITGRNYTWDYRTRGQLWGEKKRWGKGIPSSFCLVVADPAKARCPLNIPLIKYRW